MSSVTAASDDVFSTNVITVIIIASVVGVTTFFCSFLGKFCALRLLSARRRTSSRRRRRSPKLATSSSESQFDDSWTDDEAARYRDWWNLVHKGRPPTKSEIVHMKMTKRSISREGRRTHKFYQNNLKKSADESRRHPVKKKRRGEQIEDGDIALPLTESGTFVRLGMGRDGGPNLDAFMLQLEDQNLSPMPHTPPRPVKPLRINQNNQQAASSLSDSASFYDVNPNESLELNNHQAIVHHRDGSYLLNKHISQLQNKVQNSLSIEKSKVHHHLVDQDFRKSIATRIQMPEANTTEPEHIRNCKINFSGNEHMVLESKSNLTHSPKPELSIQIPDTDLRPSSVTPKSWAEPGNTGPTPKSFKSMSVENIASLSSSGRGLEVKTLKQVASPIKDNQRTSKILVSNSNQSNNNHIDKEQTCNGIKILDLTTTNQVKESSITSMAPRSRGFKHSNKAYNIETVQNDYTMEDNYNNIPLGTSQDNVNSNSRKVVQGLLMHVVDKAFTDTGNPDHHPLSANGSQLLTASQLQAELISNLSNNSFESCLGVSADIQPTKPLMSAASKPLLASNSHLTAASYPLSAANSQMAAALNSLLTAHSKLAAVSAPLLEAKSQITAAHQPLSSTNSQLTDSQLSLLSAASPQFTAVDLYGISDDKLENLEFETSGLQNENVSQLRNSQFGDNSQFEKIANSSCISCLNASKPEIKSNVATRIFQKSVEIGDSTKANLQINFNDNISVSRIVKKEKKLFLSAPAIFFLSRVDQPQKCQACGSVLNSSNSDDQNNDPMFKLTKGSLILANTWPPTSSCQKFDEKVAKF